MLQKKGWFLAYLLVCFTLLFSGSAHAYIDPAATSYMVQIVAGLVITLGVGIGVFWKKIRLFFRNIKLKALEKKLTRQAGKDSAD